MPGCIMGFIGSKSLLWSGVAFTFLTYVLRFASTLIMAFGSGLATAYAAYLVEKHKNKNNHVTQKRRKKDDRAA
jgi:hypothetical protein